MWIDFFSSTPGRAGDELRRTIEDAEPFALTGVVVTEILQGLAEYQPDQTVSSAVGDARAAGFKTYREAAAIFRLGRARGVSLTTIDAVARENSVRFQNQ